MFFNIKPTRYWWIQVHSSASKASHLTILQNLSSHSWVPACLEMLHDLPDASTAHHLLTSASHSGTHSPYCQSHHWGKCRGTERHKKKKKKGMGWTKSSSRALFSVIKTELFFPKGWYCRWFQRILLNWKMQSFMSGWCEWGSFTSSLPKQERELRYPGLKHQLQFSDSFQIERSDKATYH